LASKFFPDQGESIEVITSPVLASKVFPDSGDNRKSGDWVGSPVRADQFPSSGEMAEIK